MKPLQPHGDFFEQEWHRRFVDYSSALEDRAFLWEHFEAQPQKGWPAFVKAFIPVPEKRVPARAVFTRIATRRGESDYLRHEAARLYPNWELEATYVEYEFARIDEKGTFRGPLRDCIHFVNELSKRADAQRRLCGTPEAL